MRTGWTPEQIDTLSRMYWDHYATEIAVVLGRSVRSVYDKARQMGLKCNPEKIRRSGLMSSNNPNTIAHRFSKGHIPDNKGKRMSPEVYAQVQRTMFKKGHRPHNHRAVGSERINVDGYIEVKVAEPNRWRVKHRIIWEQVNGAIPKGFNVQFKNHNPLDCRIENLYLISKADQMAKENSFYAKYPRELQEVIHLKGVVNRAIHKAQRNGK
ncbi:MAG: HNH endonuclease [Bacteroidales bacterium]|nr:HNH endonuclease [Bacteroidales bacterium]